MKKTILTATALAAAVVMAAPASAGNYGNTSSPTSSSTTTGSPTIYKYTQTNGAVLTINTATKTGTLVGRDINTTFTSDAFANFTGGAKPTGTFVLSNLDGYRIINGKRLYDNFTGHPQKLIISPNGLTNLWSYWGTGTRYGDYLSYIGSYTPPSSSSTSTGGSTSSTSSGGSTGSTSSTSSGGSTSSTSTGGSTSSTSTGGSTSSTSTSSGGTGGSTSTGGSTGGTPVPAPGALLLFGLGAGALAFRRSRKPKV